MSASIILINPFPVSAKTIRVPQDYTTIQAAINAAKTGDSILVSTGIYYEDLIVNKEVTLKGADKATTIIDGRQALNTIRVETDGVTLTGFTVRNGNNGIRVSGGIGSANVSDNIIKSNRYGLSLIGDDVSPTTNNIISYNIFENNTSVSISIQNSLSNTITQNHISQGAYGVKIYLTNTTTISDNCLTGNSYAIYAGRTTGNTILSNTAIDNSFGIYAMYCDNTVIRDNNVTGSTYGIELYETSLSQVTYNTISDNPSYSLYLAYSDTNTIANNTISRNDWGLVLYDSLTNTILGNTISLNTYGITTNTSPSNTIYHNNIINNIDQLIRDIPSTNYWYQNGEGNYWSDYTGQDTDGDGIGETNIPHLGVDYYPLMGTWPEPTRDVAILGIYESNNKVYAGQIVNFEIVVKNEGAPFTETFNVTLQNNVTTIETQIVILPPNTNTTLIFNWNTSSVPQGIYQFSATAEAVPDETDLADNTMTDGTVTVALPLQGDINLDFIVDDYDIFLLKLAFGSIPTEPNWNANADLNKDNIVDVTDLNMLSENYGHTA